MKNAKLKKSDLAWLIVRTFGVFFAYQALASTASVLNAAIISSEFSNSLPGNFPKSQIPGIFWQRFIVPILFQVALAWYFLKEGTLIHDLLMWTKPTQLLRRKDPTDVKDLPEIPDRETTLTPTEELEFTEWLESDTMNSRGELDDQIARFRDFQATKK